MPLAEIFRISGREVPFPTIDDLISLFPDDGDDIVDVALCQSGVHRQLNVRFDPELPLALGRRSMDVYSLLFSGEEIETIPL
jgi:hypothetical protein